MKKIKKVWVVECRENSPAGTWTYFDTCLTKLSAADMVRDMKEYHDGAECFRHVMYTAGRASRS